MREGEGVSQVENMSEKEEHIVYYTLLRHLGWILTGYDHRVYSFYATNNDDCDY